MAGAAEVAACEQGYGDGYALLWGAESVENAGAEVKAHLRMIAVIPASALSMDFSLL
jgi:hypothetical protein